MGPRERSVRAHRKIRLGSVRSPTSTAKMQASFIRLKLLAVLLFICGAAGFSSTLPVEDALDALEVQEVPALGSGAVDDTVASLGVVLGSTARTTMFGVGDEPTVFGVGDAVFG